MTLYAVPLDDPEESSAEQLKREAYKENLGLLLEDRSMRRNTALLVFATSAFYMTIAAINGTIDFSDPDIKPDAVTALSIPATVISGTAAYLYNQSCKKIRKLMSAFSGEKKQIEEAPTQPSVMVAHVQETNTGTAPSLVAS